MAVIYVLELVDGCYYVGRTDWYDYRIKQHFSGEGSHWTKLHKPIKVLQILQNGTKELEKQVTMHYIKECGADKVRGAGWVATTANAKCPKSYLPTC